MGKIRFSCTKCGTSLTVAIQHVGRFAKCPKCATPVKVPLPPSTRKSEPAVIANDVTVARTKENFALQLARAFVYPFQGTGIFTLLAATAILAVLYLLVYVFLLFSLLLLIFSFYLWAYYISIIPSTVAENDELPDWPDFADLWGEVLKPVLLMCVAGFVSWLPFILYITFVVDWQARIDRFGAGLQLSEAEWLLVAWAFLYFPMGLLAVSIFKTPVALNPVLIVKSVARIPIRYFNACVLFFLIFIVNNWLGPALSGFPIVGTVVQLFFSLYMTTVAMRVLGLIYRANAEKLDWSI